MKKALIILVILLTGYSQSKDIEKDFDANQESEFVVLVCDSELKVEYMFIKDVYVRGAMLRYNAIGIPKECDY